jgi:hypothetical protein
LAVSVVSLLVGPLNIGDEEGFPEGEVAAAPDAGHDSGVNRFVVGVGEAWQSVNEAAKSSTVTPEGSAAGDVGYRTALGLVPAAWSPAGQRMADAALAALESGWGRPAQQASLSVQGVLTDLARGLRQAGAAAAEALGDPLRWRGGDQDSRPDPADGPLPGAGGQEKDPAGPGEKRSDNRPAAAPAPGLPADGAIADAPLVAQEGAPDRFPHGLALDILFASDRPAGVWDGWRPDDPERDGQGPPPAAAVAAALFASGLSQAWLAHRSVDRYGRTGTGRVAADHSLGGP